MKKTRLMVALALAFGVAATAHAGVLFDPDGSGPAGAQDVGSFDWAPTSLLALQANVAIATFVATQGLCPLNSCNFDLLTHARMIGTADQSGTPNTPAGLNSSYEITMTARFTERVTGAVDTNADGFIDLVTFTTVTTAPGFVEMFFDTSIDSVDLSGSGFNDGDVILRGTQVGASSGNFQVTDTTVVALDQSPDGNQYGDEATPPGTLTNQGSTTGTGSNTAIPVNALQTDPAFFLTPLQVFGVQFANISVGIPFVTPNPSDCFTTIQSGVPVAGPGTALAVGCDPLHIDAIMAAQISLPPGITPVIGLVNAGAAGAGPDFMAQTDFNSPLQAQVPEPGSLALAGLALGLLGMGLRRRRPVLS